MLVSGILHNYLPLAYMMKSTFLMPSNVFMMISEIILNRWVVLMSST